MLPPTAVFAQDKGALFINVSSEDPWKVSMAAFFGTNFALKEGYKPVMIFDKENRAIGQATSHSQTIYLNRLTRTNP